MPAPAHPFDLRGKVALVTGSTHGIGAATARVLAQAGAHVLVSSRKPDECEQAAQALRDEGLSAEARACHIGRMEDIAAMSAHLAAAHGGLDILVNNAGVIAIASIETITLETWRRVQSVNVDGTFLGCRHGVRVMRDRGGVILQPSLQARPRAGTRPQRY